MIFIGVDPGITGAIVAIDEKSGLLWAKAMPVHGKEIALIDLESILHGNGSCIVGVERQQPMGINGTVANFKSGYCFGAIKGILAAHPTRYVEVPAKQWQAVMLPGKPKGRDAIKAAAVQTATGLWPELNIKRKKDWGRADAALIAEVVRRKHLRGKVTG